MASRTARTTQQKTRTPLVDYSDDDSNDESNAMGIEDDHETREEYASAKDQAILGMAVFSRKFIGCNTTGSYALVSSFCCSSSLSLAVERAMAWSAWYPEVSLRVLRASPFQNQNQQLGLYLNPLFAVFHLVFDLEAMG